MLPYLFYRGGPYREFGMSDEDMHARRDLMGQLTTTNIVPDADAMLAHAARDPAASDGDVGIVGFCMSGRFAMAIAQARSERVAAIASIHGAWLVTDGPDSPHLHVDRIRAEAYFGWCANDPTAPEEHRDVIARALSDADVRHRIDFYTDAVHGYAPPGSERYHRAASEQHWERVHALLRRRL
jgi:carboxymethylenebutenolidase